MTEDPKRLIDNADESALVREHLQVAAGRSPVSYDVGAGLEQLEASVEAGATGTASSSAWWSSPGAWVVGAGILGAAFLLMRPDPRPTQSQVAVTENAQESEDADPLTPPPEEEPVPVPSPTSETAAEKTPQGEADEHAQVDGAPDTASDPAPDRAAKGKSAAPASTKEDAGDDGAFRREMELMASARKALARDPAGTLRLTARAAKEFPKGFFAEEREALTVLALVGLGRNELAQKRAKAFLQRYPSGTFSEKVKQAAPRSSDQ
jgi:hypothetical protein